MQQIARELNNSETAFVFQEHHADYDVLVRFFTPTMEVPTCGHATIATHYVRAIEHQLTGTTNILQKTGAGILPVTVVQKDSDYQVIMTQGPIEINPILPMTIQEEILNAFGLSVSDCRTDCPMQIVSTGNGKVMIGIHDVAKLNQLRPNMTALIAISQKINCTGYYVFTLTPDQTTLVHGRMFAPAAGINENPVTGNANGPLSAYLVHHQLVTVK